MLKAWVEGNEVVENIESTLMLSRTQEGEMTTGKELLTIGEMQSKGFSQNFGYS